MQKKFNLRILILTYSLVLVVVTCSIAAIGCHQKYSEILTRESERRAELYMKNIYYQMREAVLLKKTNTFADFSQSLQEEEALAYALIFDTKGSLLVHFVKKGIHKEQPLKNFNPSDFKAQVSTSYSPEILDMTKSISDPFSGGKDIGYIRIGISMSGFNSLENQITLSQFSLLIFILLAVFLISLPAIAYFEGQFKKCLDLTIFNSKISKRDISSIRELAKVQHRVNTLVAQSSKAKAALGEIIDELSMNQDRLDLALESSQAGLWDWNVKTGEVIFNDRWFTMLGYEPGELKGNVSTWEALLNPKDKEEVSRRLASHLKGETPLYQTEHRVRCKDNRWLWILDTGRVVEYDQQKKPVRAIGTHIDIHHIKSVETRLQIHKDNLQTIVRAKTKKLEKTQKELLNKAIDAGRAQLSAMVLHNIGNAITPVMLNMEKLQNNKFEHIGKYLSSCYAELAQHKGNLDHFITENKRGKKVADYMGDLIDEFDKLQQSNEKIVNTISAGVEYVGQVLSLQRAYAPKKGEMKEMVSLNHMAEDVLRIQEGTIDKRKIKVVYKLEPLKNCLSIEKNKLMQVLVNLLKNSCDAIDENQDRQEHTITVQTFSNKESIGINISDTGCGLEEQQLEKIFDLGISSKGSSGFGLYYCQSFVESNHGRLTIKSAGKNMGATASLVFPVLPQEDKTNEKPSKGRDKNEIIDD